MRKIASVLAVAGLCAAASSAMADQTYFDNVFDVFTGAGGGILDFDSMTITDNGTNSISFTMSVIGDVVATDWGKYCVILKNGAGGDPVGDGWARPYGMTEGATNWLGSWVDSGNGAEAYHYNGSGWVLDHATYSDGQITISKTNFTVTLTTSLSNLGLYPGAVFWFDAMTSGGGGSDGAVDSLGNPNQQIADWGNYSTAVWQTYTVTPTPGAAAVLGLAGLGAFKRRRR